MCRKLFFIAFVVWLLWTPMTAYSSPKTCPDKTLGSDSIEGIYSGVEDGDFSWLMLDVDGESMTFMADSEELEAAFGQNPVGKRIAVEYEIRQFWNEYGNECSRLNVFKSGKLVSNC